MSKPIVAIVGRPNVGKSTLFNKISGSRISIVEDTPGVTRDRIYNDIEWNGRALTLVDTGGIEPRVDDMMLGYMREQAQTAIETADVIVFMVDVTTGVTASDRDVATMLMKSRKPLILCVNKVDSVGELPMEYYEFYELGIDGDPIPVSSVHGTGTGDLLDRIVELFLSIAAAIQLFSRINGNVNQLSHMLLLRVGQHRLEVRHSIPRNNRAKQRKQNLDQRGDVNGSRHRCFLLHYLSIRCSVISSRTFFKFSMPFPVIS